MSLSLSEFAKQVAGQPLLELQFQVFADQIRRWSQGERVLMQDYLKLIPELGHAIPKQLLEHDRLLEEAYRGREALKNHSTAGPAFETLKVESSLLKELQSKGAVNASGQKIDSRTNEPEGKQLTPEFPDIPGFVLEKKLGMGGMGVVYKARQQLPNRVVALKVMRYGSQQDLQRFLGEAEAIAKIQHPHIVGVYQVEILKDQPILVLEYLPGGNLREKMAGKPQASNHAAALMHKVALAVQAAHDAGVIHRDLKPANILLDHHDEPKITDFGLAKQSESESGLTASGAIMGSPSYMSPEQAMGKVREIGPLTDVYALGAILYEMLTGRAPFLGEDPHETIMQVINQDPVSIRQLSPSVPRNLETICHKCLQKERAGRYQSAKALAEDLQCFLDGSPIVARRAGIAERSWRWMRRHPMICLLLLAIIGCAAAVGWIIWQYQLSTVQKSGYAGLKTLFEKALTADFRRYESQQQIYQALLHSAELLEGKGIFTPEDSARHYQQLGRLAMIQGNAAQARKAWEKAIRFITTTAEPSPSLQLVNAQALLQLGKLDSDEGHWDQSLRHLNASSGSSQTLIPVLAAQRSDTVMNAHFWTACEAHADAMHELANWQYRKRQFNEAIQGFKKAIELREGNLKELTRHAPSPALQGDELLTQRSIRRGIARSYGYLGDVLRAQGDLEQAMSAYAASESGRQSLVDEMPSDDEACFQLARSFENRGNLQARLDHHVEAVTALRKAEKLLIGIMQEQPGIAEYQYDLARVSNRLAAWTLDPDNPASATNTEARRLLERSVQLTEGLRKRDKVSLNYRGEWSYAVAHQARLTENQETQEKLIKEAREQLEQLRKERSNPEDAYGLLLCEVLQKSSDLRSAQAKIIDEVQKGVAHVSQLKRDRLFQGLFSD